MSGCVAENIKFWDLRFSSSVRTIDHKMQMTALAAHSNIPMFATGSPAQFIKIMSHDGSTQQVIRYRDRLPGQRIGPVSCLCFHPQLPLVFGRWICRRECKLVHMHRKNHVSFELRECYPFTYITDFYREGYSHIIGESKYLRNRRGERVYVFFGLKRMLVKSVKTNKLYIFINLILWSKHKKRLEIRVIPGSPTKERPRSGHNQRNQIKVCPLFWQLGSLQFHLCRSPLS